MEHVSLKARYEDGNCKCTAGVVLPRRFKYVRFTLKRQFCSHLLHFPIHFSQSNQILIIVQHKFTSNTLYRVCYLGILHIRKTDNFVLIHASDKKMK